MISYGDRSRTQVVSKEHGGLPQVSQSTSSQIGKRNIGVGNVSDVSRKTTTVNESKLDILLSDENNTVTPVKQLPGDHNEPYNHIHDSF